MPEFVFVGNIYAFILTIVLFMSVAVTCHVYLIKVKKCKRYDKLSFIANIILSVVLSIIFMMNFEFSDNRTIEDQNILPDTQAVALHKSQPSDHFSVTASDQRLEKMSDEK